MGQRVYTRKALDVDDLRQNLIDARVGVTLISGADVSMHAFEPQADILNIHRDIDYPKHY